MAPPPPSTENAPEGEVKSIHHDWPSYVEFINRTLEPVDLIWRDYNGLYVCYKHGLAPGRSHFMNTYVSHPWQAWCTGTMEKLKVGGQFIFMPQAWSGERSRTKIYIDSPLRSLLKLCLHKVRRLVQTNNIDALEIPTDLHRRLKRRKNIDVRYK